MENGGRGYVLRGLEMVFPSGLCSVTRYLGCAELQSIEMPI